jgi:hypothetical protein
MKFSRFVVPAALGLIGLSATTQAAHADIINITASNRGYFDSNGIAGTTDADSSYLAGQVNNGTVTQYANFFGFDLSSLRGQTISSAQLLVSRASGISPDPNETYTLYDVAAMTPLVQDTDGSAINRTVYNDLRSGNTYGSITVATPQPLSTAPYIIDLNSTALADIRNRNGSYINIGGAVTTISGTSSQYLFLNAFNPGSNYTTQLSVTTVPTPEPSTYAMMALGLVALCVLGAKRKKEGQIS